ncbi:fatty acyl-CoA reductase 1 [Osmia bicornis bicornis]|uniref:fatty acyl-CoA reductase 1 n=1 Tax=Osmia bicornis bicornis TaxID=1437191 RepID=UPI0010F4A331|nr:fatty acyl-CoA reductase 1 [Osmia bicornis bicornis]
MNNVKSDRWQLEEKISNNGQIRQFYAGKRILLSGATGFFGTSILEKLLRTCLEIDKIYVLIRPKKNMSIKQRMKNYFENTAFDTLRKVNPNFMSKVEPIYSDLIKDDLAISPEDRRYLKQNVDIIIHNAAEVSFSATVASTLRINVFGTKYMLDLAAECFHLKAFLYVSTAYSNCYTKDIEEKFYPPPADLKMIEDMIRSDEEAKYGMTDIAVRQMIGKWPNVYTFSKSMAESLIQNFSHTSVICAIFRPSIVVGSYEEPVPGWVGNQNGPAIMFIAMSMGLVHTARVLENCIMDVVPVDLAVNGLLASVWDLCVRKQSKGPQVYNYGSSFWKPVHLLGYRKLYHEIIEEYPLNNTIWFPFIVITENLYVFFVLHFLLHVIPAALNDFFSLLLGKGAKGLKLVVKFTKYITTLDHFTNFNWVVEVENTQNILIYMNSTDYKEFPFDLGRLDWNKCSRHYFLGIKRNLLNEPLDQISAARKRFQRLKILHYTVSIIFLLSVVFITYKIICNAFSCQ